MNNIKFFNISDGIDIIKIHKNFLVFDTHSKKMYEISKTAFKILKSCESGKSLYSITREVDLLIEFLKKCEVLGIGQFDVIRNKRHKKTFLKNKIDMVWLVVTDYCNYKCLHCYESAKNQTLVEKLQIRDYKRFLNLLTQKYEIGCIQITGGEPLARGKTFIFDLIYEIKKYGINDIEIFTNLSLMDNEYYNFLKNNNIKIATSFYSRNEHVHDEITGVKGSQKKSICNINKAISYGINVRIGIVLMEKNKDEAESLRSWLNNKFGLCEKKRYDVVRPLGRGANRANIPKELFIKKFVNYLNLNYYDFDKYFYNKHFNSCWGNKICLKSDGMLYPCIMSSLKLGKYTKVNRILTKKNSYRFLSKDKIKLCKKCKFKYLCDECRPMNECFSKKLNSRPHLCAFDPIAEKWDKDLIKEIIDENQNKRKRFKNKKYSIK